MRSFIAFLLAALTAGVLIYFLSGAHSVTRPESVPAAPDANRPFESAHVIAHESGRTASRRTVVENSGSRPEVQTNPAAPNAPPREISGVVRLPDGLPAGGIEVELIESDEERARDASLYGRLSEPKTLRKTRAGSEGTFRFENLKDDCEYRLRTYPVEPLAFDMRRDGFDKGVETTAPNNAVVLVWEMTGVDVELIPPPGEEHMFEGNSGPSGGMEFFIHKDGQTSTASFGGALRRHMLCAVEPDRTLTITVRTRFKPVRIENIVIGNRGFEKVRAPLVPWKGNKLFLILKNEAGGAITKAGVREVGSDLRVSRFEEMSGVFLDSATGEFTLDRIPPGPVELDVRPHPSSGCVPKRIMIQMPEEGELREECRLEMGGTVRIRVTGSAGASTNIEVYAGGASDDFYKSITTQFYCGDPFGSPVMNAGNEYTIDRALAPGSYVLKSWTGKGPSREFIIRKGEETVVDLVLED